MGQGQCRGGRGVQAQITEGTTYTIAFSDMLIFFDFFFDILYSAIKPQDKPACK